MYVYMDTCLRNMFAQSRGITFGAACTWPRAFHAAAGPNCEKSRFAPSCLIGKVFLVLVIKCSGKKQCVVLPEEKIENLSSLPCKGQAFEVPHS